MKHFSKSIIAFFLLLVISFVLVPKELWHDHEGEKTVFVKKQINHTSMEEAIEDCDICDFDQPTEFEDCKMKVEDKEDCCMKPENQFRVLERLFEDLLNKNSSRAPPCVG